MKFYIYQIWFPTSKKSYIGQTYNIKKRMQEHLHSGSVVCHALWKYDDWQITILHTTNSRELANQLEIEDIRNHNSVTPNGYNLTKGGDGVDGYKHTKETIEKMKIAKLGDKNPAKNLEVRKRLSKAAKERKERRHTKETKEKISKTKIGKKRKPFSKKWKIKLAIARQKYWIKKLEND